MKPCRNQKGFTLIELLIVVAIIGVLAAVGIPMYNGYIVNSKINATKESHQRVLSFIGATFTKCAASGGSITLKTSASGATKDYPCTMYQSKWVQPFDNHFDYDGWKNPHDSKEDCCAMKGGPDAGGHNPVVGKTHIFHTPDNRIRITTNVGTDSGADSFLVGYTIKE